MKDKIKGMLIGITIGSLLTTSAALASNGTTIKAVMQKMSLYVDGAKKTEASVIVYKNITYVPVRTISTAIGKDVSLLSGNLYIGKQPQVEISLQNAFELVSKKFKKELEEDNVRLVSDGTNNQYYIITLTKYAPDRRMTLGVYYVDMYSGVVYKFDPYESILTEI